MDNFTDGLKSYHYAQCLKTIGYEEEAKYLMDNNKLNIKTPKKIINVDGNDYYILPNKSGLSMMFLMFMGVKKVGISKEIFDKLKNGEFDNFPYFNPIDDDKYVLMADGTLHIK